jgi:hypothetical protein
MGEIARLQHGEDDTPREPGAWPTPGQWIHRWNRLLPEQRLKMAAQMIEWEQQASACRELDHADRIQELGARVVTLTEQLTDHRAALKRVRAGEFARCASCDHLTSDHQPDGCWFTVTLGASNHDLVCPCTAGVPREGGS